MLASAGTGVVTAGCFISLRIVVDDVVVVVIAVEAFGTMILESHPSSSLSEDEESSTMALEYLKSFSVSQAVLDILKLEAE
ncbi:unnamed protein product [Ambrosiozyma monospora]|uniref:Unnamed protein product n=1 Tax=Ambrosiozyma monospora TaxID=43982 RepID=A0ACB5SXZ1_AMBMO|nr:unnamed protein product [Ambrosiozyma monospora]